MQIVIISPGEKPKGPEKELLEDYLARISRSFKVEVQTPNFKLNLEDKEKLKELEAEKILKNVKVDDFLILLDEAGVKFKSEAFAKKFEVALSSPENKRIVFVIGGAYGSGLKLKQRANLVWSFSDQVFPHRLFRAMLTEQIYRSLEIIKGSPYHH
jgi:23S rRNA (pseudouridine1915-N3)-methyltransferase